MTVLTRIPIAHGGLVGFPAAVLKCLSCQGKYDYIDNWNRFACHMKLIPAGEYIVFKKNNE